MVLLLNTVLIVTVTCFTVTVEADTEVSDSLNDISNSSPILVCNYIGKFYTSTYTTCMYSCAVSLKYVVKKNKKKHLPFLLH